MFRYSIESSESDDDDEVVAFVDESDSETEVPVNTPGSTPEMPTSEDQKSGDFFF